MSRDNFSKETVRVLAMRVAYKCSNPDCRKPTSGPNRDPEKASIVGVAAHITAAAKNGPRYNSSLTTAERKSAENGIWLCETHAALIDKDEQNYPIGLLLRWKSDAEGEAQTNVEREGTALEAHWRRRRLIVAVATLGVAAVILAFFSLSQGGRLVRAKSKANEANAISVQLQHRIDEITQVRDQLQERLDKERLRSQHLAGGVKAITIVGGNTRDLMLALEELLSEFQSDFDRDNLSKLQLREIQLAEATKAIAGQRYEIALQLLPKRVEEFEKSKTETQIDNELSVLRVSGAAYYGLQNWNEALKRYQRMDELRPSVDNKWMQARCLNHLENLRDAAILYDDVVQYFLFQVEDRGQEGLRDHLAWSHSNRGVVMAKQEALESAIRDFSRAINIQLELVREGRADLKSNLAGDHNNLGIALSKAGDLDSAIRAFDEAIARQNLLVEEESLTEIEVDLAISLSNRGKALSMKGKKHLAVQDMDKSISLLMPIIKKGRTDLESDLAAFHERRGDIFNELQLQSQAIQDYEKAIALYSDLVKGVHKIYLREDLARILNNCAWLMLTTVEKAKIDDKKTLNFAKLACEYTKYREWSYIDTLAAAHAAAGNFDEASKWQLTAIDLAPAESKMDLAARLRRYQGVQP